VILFSKEENKGDKHDVKVEANSKLIEPKLSIRRARNNVL